ncbi:hypothetical protein [Rosistilla carotiformis]|uniref:hypothetical protein n=1 Tax=Rosistilla carotiformis TaxID=2528017 RepID=UPI0018D22DA0|nr:hypothetical protein [Rosistilla carotiformis]
MQIVLMCISVVGILITTMVTIIMTMMKQESMILLARQLALLCRFPISMIRMRSI